MNDFILDTRSLQLIAAQARLNGTFHHTCRSALTRQQLAFRLQVERNTPNTTFTVEMGGDRHSLTLAQSQQKPHLAVADFVEAIANGRIDTAEPAAPRITDHSADDEPLLGADQERQLRDLVRSGGLLSLALGFEQPLHAAIHRNQSRPGITTILSLDEGQPLTTCFTLYCSDAEAYQRVVESIEHMAAIATPAPQAA